MVRLHNYTRLHRRTRGNSSYDYCKWSQLYATILRFICTPNTMGVFANHLLISIRRFQFPNLLRGSPYPPLPKMPRRPAEFFHMFYMDWEHYPCGVADVVGYWAEYQLFGGVVLFDRGMSKTEVCCC